MADKKKPAPKKTAKAPRKKRKQQGSSTGVVVNVPAVQTNWRKQLQQSRIKFDDVQKIIYLDALASHGMKGQAAEAANVSMQTVVDHTKNDPDFEEARTTALETYRDKFVDHAMNLALEGEVQKTYDRDGNLIGEKHTYPIRLIELELKRIDPGYRDKQTIDLNATGGGVLVAPAAQTPADWIKSQKAANDSKQAPEGIKDVNRKTGGK